MNIPTTYLSLHDVTALRATVLATMDTPLVLSIDTPHGAMQISLYIRDLDTSRIERLTDAINTALRGPEPNEAAAYNAQNNAYHYKGGAR